MDKIFECTQNFNKLLDINYVFTIVSERKLKKFVLNFQKEDFRHIAGLHYIDDISIENNPTKLYNSILTGFITDHTLLKSKKYISPLREGGSIQERVAELCHLEEYLDKSDIIRIFKMQDFGSSIHAEYFIEAINSNRHTSVYIFVRKRLENDTYVIVSFFKKSTTYKGSMAYWMKKEKITTTENILLYENPTFLRQKNDGQ